MLESNVSAWSLREEKIADREKDAKQVKENGDR